MDLILGCRAVNYPCELPQTSLTNYLISNNTEMLNYQAHDGSSLHVMQQPMDLLQHVLDLAHPRLQLLLYYLIS